MQTRSKAKASVNEMLAKIKINFQKEQQQNMPKSITKVKSPPLDATMTAVPSTTTTIKKICLQVCDKVLKPISCILGIIGGIHSIYQIFNAFFEEEMEMIVMYRSRH